MSCSGGKIRICGVYRVESIKIWGLEILSAGNLFTVLGLSLESPGGWLLGVYSTRLLRASPVL